MSDNPVPNYLAKLTARLMAGLRKTPEVFRQRHRDFLVAGQNLDGGFSGRQGGSDLYYTAFALRSLVCLGELDEPVQNRAAKFLSGRLGDSASVVDFMSLLVAANFIRLGNGPDVLGQSDAQWPNRVVSALEAFHKADGGYAKSTEATAGSTYHNFLVALSYELISRELPDPQRVVGFLRSRSRDDGGFVEVAPAWRGGTNPTAAAIALLKKLGALDPAIIAHTGEFLGQMQSSEGGLKANRRTPLADLLSTFTGLVTLIDLEAPDRVDLDRVGSYVESLEVPSGGFRGGTWDADTDVEYTFYGLGTIALLRSLES